MKRVCTAAALTLLVAPAALAQTIAPEFADNYTFVDLGPPPGVVARLGGLTMLAGSSNTLLVGGQANSPSGTLYAVPVTRDVDGHINGFAGDATVYGSAPYNDGGITYGPNGVLFAAQWPVNMLSQYAFGSTNPTRVIDLTPLGSAGSNAAVYFVPQGIPGAGRMKLSSWSGGNFYDATFAPDGNGTFDVTALTETAVLPCGPEGFAYVPTGSPGFTSPAMIVSEYSCGSVSVFDIDAQGDPIIASRREFMFGLGGAEGAFIDTPTGDFLFTTFGGGDRIVLVRGFAGNPGCDPDVTCDGNVDQDDVACLIDVIAGNPGCECQDPDFNRDGNVDQDDVAALINVVAGGACP